MSQNILKLTNTLSGKKELFIPLHPNMVNMYVCGVTPYDNAHLGHGRVYVTFDILYRLLKFLGYKVIYCRNFTDIDDKLLNKAQNQYNDKLKYKDIANHYINSFNEDMNLLNCLLVDFQPKVTDSIDDIIGFIKGLIDKELAYSINGDVYFEVNKFADYGKLSKRKLTDLKAGARVEIDKKKRSPLDFALWKSEENGTFWKSPWGYGRPGWHIECSSLAEKFLGKQIDIHGGGMDLIFPHHENEIAQSEGLFNQLFSRYWVHVAFVRINQEKMSKSLGNFFILKDIFKNFDPMVVRFYYANHNYNIPIDFSLEELEKTKRNYQKLCKIFELVTTENISSNDLKKSDIVTKLNLFLCDDLNMAGLFGVLYENLDFLKKNRTEFAAVKLFLQEVLGLNLKPLPEIEVEITPEIQKLIDEREEARRTKDWKKSDTIRDILKKMGIEVQDKTIKK